MKFATFSKKKTENMVLKIFKPNLHTVPHVL